jgi:hypothetical protein
MQLGYQVPVLQIVASNANFTSDWIRVPVGSSVRLTAAITAIVGAPAGTLFLEFANANLDPVAIFTLACAAVSSSTNFANFAPEFARVRLAQAGGGNSLTMSADLIVIPPDSTPA